MPDWVTWLLGGGMASVTAILVKVLHELETLRIKHAESSAKAAQFAVSEAGSGTQVAGENIFRGLMATIVQREQEAHQLTILVQQQLVDERRSAADIRERYAAMVEKEEYLLFTNAHLAEQLKQQAEVHRVEMKTLRGRLKGTTAQVIELGGTFSATDVVGEDKST